MRCYRSTARCCTAFYHSRLFMLRSLGLYYTCTLTFPYQPVKSSREEGKYATADIVANLYAKRLTKTSNHER